MTLQDYRDQIKEYQQSLPQEVARPPAGRLDAEVIEKAMRSVDDRRHQWQYAQPGKTPDTAITARQQFLQQKHSMDQRLSRLYDDERAQEQAHCQLDQNVHCDPGKHHAIRRI